jgi:hypothetical protein
MSITSSPLGDFRRDWLNTRTISGLAVLDSRSDEDCSDGPLNIDGRGSGEKACELVQTLAIYG